MNKNVELITELADAFGPSGFEDEVVNTARRYTKDLDVYEDHMRNFYMKPKNFSGKKLHVLLDAHSDEVGFMVHSVRPDGSLRFTNLGSPTLATLASDKVRIRNDRGEFIPGIISSVSPHYAKTSSANAGAITQINQLSMDVGATSDKEAEEEFAITMGEPATFDTTCEYDEEHGLIFGKAFDCRVGCAAFITTLNRIKDMDLGVDVSGVLAIMEEFNAGGAQIAAQTVKPDLVICFEGCPADDTIASGSDIQTRLKHGPFLRHMDGSMISHPRFQKFALDTAKKYGIKWQAGVREGSGTNGMKYHVANQGIPTIVMGIPVRYAHSANGITAEEDFENAVELTVRILTELNENIFETF